MIWSDDHAEIDVDDPIRHTAFRLLACEECRHVETFPKENYALTTDRYKAALREQLATRNWRLQE